MILAGFEVTPHDIDCLPPLIRNRKSPRRDDCEP